MLSLSIEEGYHHLIRSFYDSEIIYQTLNKKDAQLRCLEGGTCNSNLTHNKRRQAFAYV